MNNTVYVFQGGLKAVIWTDVLQCTIMFIGLVSVTIKVSFQTGHFSNSVSSEGMCFLNAFCFKQRFLMNMEMCLSLLFIQLLLLIVEI